LKRSQRIESDQPKRILAMTVCYDGTDYLGFQRQPNGRTIQGELETALGEVLQERVTITAAGRTDAGVHALGQVISLNTDCPIPVKGLLKAANDRLPTTVRIRRAWNAPIGFHARGSGRWRRYWYIVDNRIGVHPDPFRGRYTWLVTESLDVAKMQQAMEAVKGQHDFTSFCHGHHGGNAQRSVRHASLTEIADSQGAYGHRLKIDVKANAFLHQMMRLLVANLVRIGTGEKPIGWLNELLAMRDRHQAGVAAPPQGLWLMYVGYGPGMRACGTGEQL
jgi:tRNA pseudouridine38-40 synthase